MNKTIFALHGFLGVPQDWDWLKLSGFNIIPVDYMNTRGLTPDTPLDKWGENFNLWSKKIAPSGERFLIGYSMGGRLALQALFQSYQTKNQIWNKAVFISTNPGLTNEEDKKSRLISDARWSQKFLTMDFQRVVKDWNEQAVFENSVNEPLRRPENYNPEMLAKAMTQWSVSKQNNFLQEKDFFNSNQLWVAGEYDKKYLAINESIKALSKSIDTEIINKASHRVIFDQPEKLLSVIKDYISPEIKNPRLKKIQRSITDTFSFSRK